MLRTFAATVDMGRDAGASTCAVGEPEGGRLRERTATAAQVAAALLSAPVACACVT